MNVAAVSNRGHSRLKLCVGVGFCTACFGACCGFSGLFS